MFTKTLNLLNKNLTTSKKVILLSLLAISLSSCMMMMPDHMSSMHVDHNNANPDITVDKVCGKNVGKDSSFTYEYVGTTYYFDTEQCLTVFKNNPDHFLQKSADSAHKKNMKTTMWIGGAIVMSAMMITMMIIAF